MVNTVGNGILEAAVLTRRLQRLGALLANQLEGAAGGGTAEPLGLLERIDRSTEELGEVAGAVLQALAAGRLPGGRSAAEAAAALAAVVLERLTIEAALTRAAGNPLPPAGEAQRALAIVEARVVAVEDQEAALAADLAAYLWTSALLG